MNTEQERAELLPCPFCGGKAHFSRSEDLVNVRCEGWNPGKCLGAGPNCYTETDAAAGWNRRAALQSQDRDAKRVIDAARIAMDNSTECGDGSDGVALSSDHAAALSLALDEYDHARRIEGGGE